MSKATMLVECHDHGAFVQRKVDAAQTSADAGQGRPNGSVEADFTERRTRINKAIFQSNT